MSNAPFKFHFRVRLRDTDAAGVIYFSRLLERAHEAYEAFLDSAGLPLQTWMAQGPRLPIVHAEADFSAPMELGTVVRVALKAARVGRSSFTLDYEFTTDDGAQLARAQTVHVAVEQGETAALPETLRDQITAILTQRRKGAKHG